MFERWVENEFEDFPVSHGKTRVKWLNDFKKRHGCSICGYKRCLTALEFHHADKKRFNISGWIRVPPWKIIEEIYKCVILCANCHAELHSDINK